MDRLKRHYLLSTPRDKLSPSDKRLQTMINKYGSISNAMKHRSVGDLVLGGYNGGIQRVSKGFGKWEKQTLTAYAKSRSRDSRGRFIREGDGHEDTTEEAKR